MANKSSIINKGESWIQGCALAYIPCIIHVSHDNMTRRTMHNCQICCKVMHQEHQDAHYGELNISNSYRHGMTYIKYLT